MFYYRESRGKIKKSIRVSVFIDQFSTCKGDRIVTYERKRERIVIFQEARSEVEKIF